MRWPKRIKQNKSRSIQIVVQPDSLTVITISCNISSGTSIQQKRPQKAGSPSSGKNNRGEIETVWLVSEEPFTKVLVELVKSCSKQGIREGNADFGKPQNLPIHIKYRKVFWPLKRFYFDSSHIKSK